MHYTGGGPPAAALKFVSTVQECDGKIILSRNVLLYLHTVRPYFYVANQKSGYKRVCALDDAWKHKIRSTSWKHFESSRHILSFPS